MTQLFGQTYAPLYDAFYEEKDYGKETELLIKVFQKYAQQSVKKVLDLGCGTGNHSLHLASRGYEVTGVDRSKEMLLIADLKASSQDLNLHFRHGDIRGLELGETFDAVLMMFAVLGYQVKDDDILDTLLSARRHLTSGGLLIFDVWYGPAVLAQGAKERFRTVTNNGETWERTASGKLTVERNLCNVEILLQQTENGEVLAEAKESHTVRYLFPKEIEHFLELAGFQLLRLGQFPAFDCQPNDDTWNVMAVADTA